MAKKKKISARTPKREAKIIASLRKNGWFAEIERRSAELDAVTAQTVPWEVVKERAWPR
jgi:hypothetical protein